MARTLNGSSDDIVFTIGGLSAMAYGTVAAIARFDDFNDWGTLFGPHDSGGSRVGSVQVQQSTGLFEWIQGLSTVQAQTLSTSVWYFLLVRKGTGNVTPRFSVYNYTTSAWSHQAGSMGCPNWPTPGASGTIRQSNAGTSDFHDGEIAVRAAWSNLLPWAATSGGDPLIEATGMHLSLAAWFNATPTALWVYDQSATTQTIPDLTGGGANQSSLSGTTVSTLSVPSFSYSADLFVTRTHPTAGAPPPIEGPENSSTMYNRGFGKG